jgi:hypothetical protein
VTLPNTNAAKVCAVTEVIVENLFTRRIPLLRAAIIAASVEIAGTSGGIGRAGRSAVGLFRRFASGSLG